MPDWQGLGYIQTAANLSNERANRKQQGWLALVSSMNDYFKTQGARDYELNKLLPAQTAAQGGLEKLAYDIQGPTRAEQARQFGVGAEADAAKLAEQKRQFDASLALDRSKLAMEGAGQQKTAADVVNDYISRIMGTGVIPLDKTGQPDFAALRSNPALLAEVIKNFDSYLPYSGYTGNAKQAKEWLQKFLSLGGLPSANPNNNPANPAGGGGGLAKLFQGIYNFGASLPAPWRKEEPAFKPPDQSSVLPSFLPQTPKTGTPATTITRPLQGAPAVPTGPRGEAAKFNKSDFTISGNKLLYKGMPATAQQIFWWKQYGQ